MQPIGRVNFYGASKRDGFDAMTPPPLLGGVCFPSLGCWLRRTDVFRYFLSPASRGWVASDHQVWHQQALHLGGGSVPPPWLTMGFEWDATRF